MCGSARVRPGCGFSGSRGGKPVTSAEVTNLRAGIVSTAIARSREAPPKESALGWRQHGPLGGGRVGDFGRAWEVMTSPREGHKERWGGGAASP